MLMKVVMVLMKVRILTKVRIINDHHGGGDNDIDSPHLTSTMMI